MLEVKASITLTLWSSSGSTITLKDDMVLILQLVNE